MRVAPVRRDLSLPAKDADCKTRGISRAERRGFERMRTQDWGIEQVGLELHQQIVRRHAAVDAERRHGPAGVLRHGGEHLARLKRRRLERRPRDVSLGGEPREASDDPPGVRPPSRREEPRKGRYEIDVAIVLDAAGQRLDL